MSLASQPSQGGAKFLTVKAGKFYLSTDKEYKNPYTQLDGHLTDVYNKTETFTNNQGKEVSIGKTYFVVTSEEGAYQFNLKHESNSWALLIGFLKNANLRDPMTIYVREGEQVGDNITSSFFVQQNGTYMKSFYKKDSGNQLPAWVKHEIGDKVIWDKTGWKNALIADVQEMKSKIGGSSVQPKQQSHNPAPQQPQLNSQGFPPPDDKFDDSDLPF